MLNLKTILIKKMEINQYHRNNHLNNNKIKILIHLKKNEKFIIISDHSFKNTNNFINIEFFFFNCIVY